MGAVAPKPPLAIPPHSKLWGFLAFSHEWPETYPDQIETFIAGRGIMLANYLLCSKNPDDQEMAPDYLARIEERLTQFLDGK